MSANDTKMIPRDLNIGIYGCTHAGKTRFLYQLLNGWHKAYRLLNPSPACQSFLSAVEGDVKTYGRTQPTTATLRDISVTVRREANEPPWRVTLRDIRGEYLSASLEEAGKRGAEPHIPDQVKQCDAFLFFFDPTSEDTPDEIDAHYSRELEQARRFMRYVLRIRQNRHLPIVFVQTRLDKWEGDEAVQAKSAAWFDTVNESYRRLYRGLQEHQPHSLTDRDLTSMTISSTREPAEVERVLHRLDKLVGEVQSFTTEDKSAVAPLVASAIMLFAVFLGLIGYTSWADTGEPNGTATHGQTPDRTQIHVWQPAEVRGRLDELRLLLAAHPAGRQLPTDDEAEQINGHLRWLLPKLEFARQEAATDAWPAELTEQMAAVLQQTAELVSEKLDAPPGVPARQHIGVLTRYLSDVRDPTGLCPEISQARERFWRVYRDCVVQDLAERIARHDAAATEPVAVLQDIVRSLGDLETDVNNSRVIDYVGRESLISEMQNAATFCQNRLKAGNYQVAVGVVSATLRNKFGITPNRRRLTVQSPRQQPLQIDLQVRKSADSDTQCILKAPDDRFQASLSLGDAGRVLLFIRSDQRDDWDELDSFNLEPQAGEPSLAALGMPLVRRAEPTIAQRLTTGGYTIRIELTAELSSNVPDIIWESAELARESTP